MPLRSERKPRVVRPPKPAQTSSDETPSNKHNNSQLINKYTEYLLYNDILFFTWKLLPSLTAKTNPNELYIVNYLLLLEKLQLKQHPEPQFLCGSNNGNKAPPCVR